MRQVASLNYFVYFQCILWLLASVSCTELVYMSTEMDSLSHLAIFRQLSLTQCKNLCKERISCEYINFKARSHVCYLIAAISGSRRLRHVDGSGVMSSSKTSWDMSDYTGCASCYLGQACIETNNTCVTAECSLPPLYTNTTIKGNIYSLSGRVAYTCDIDTRKTSHSQCLTNGSWSSITAVCNNSDLLSSLDLNSAGNPMVTQLISTTTTTPRTTTTTTTPRTTTTTTTPRTTTTSTTTTTTTPPPSTTTTSTTTTTTTPPPSTTTTSTTTTTTTPPPSTTTTSTTTTTTTPPPSTTTTSTTTTTTTPPPSTTTTSTTTTAAHPPSTTTTSTTTTTAAHPLSTTTTSTTTSTTTPSLATYDWFTCGSSWFLYNVSQVTWYDASIVCTTYGGHLAYLKDTSNGIISCIETNYYARYTGRKNFWIGATDQVTEGSFKWLDGSDLVSSNALWDIGEPNSLIGDEDCVSFYTKEFFWNDADCTTNRSVLCEQP